MDQLTLTISKKNAGSTIKEVLKCFGVGRPQIEKIRTSHSAQLNNEVASLETITKKGDVLSLLFEEEIDFIPEAGPLIVLYEDDNYLSVEKPANMLVHPDSKDKKGTLVNLVAYYYKQNGLHRRIRYAHRIDYETSGIVVFAKHFLSDCYLKKQIELGLIKKQYLLLAHNRFKNVTGKLSYPIGQDRHTANKMRVANNGKPSTTYYKVVKTYPNNITLVSAHIETGRTHQIRVHFSFVNHPLVGDTLYGGSNTLIKRVALHAYSVEFFDPFSMSQLVIKSPLSKDMEALTK